MKWAENRPQKSKGGRRAAREGGKTERIKEERGKSETYKGEKGGIVQGQSHEGRNAEALGEVIVEKGSIAEERLKNRRERDGEAQEWEQTQCPNMWERLSHMGRKQYWIGQHSFSLKLWHLHCNKSPLVSWCWKNVLYPTVTLRSILTQLSDNMHKEAGLMEEKWRDVLRVLIREEKAHPSLCECQILFLCH